MSDQKRILPYLVPITLLVVALFYRLGYMPLSADEPIRALIALDMEVDGNYLAPELNGDPYLNKPPLYNWLLLILFKVTGNHSEWLIRLPSVIPLLIFAWLIYKTAFRITQHREVSVISALAFCTTGNLLFYSSYLGHIDVLYSAVVFGQILLIIKAAERNKPLSLLALSYFLAWIGFMMKGLPSIVFQGVTLFVVFIHHKKLKDLFKTIHLLSSLAFIIPIAGYLYAYRSQGNALDLVQRLVLESTSRTVTDKSFLESIGHLFTFPFSFMLDTLPWGLSCLILLKKSARNELRQHPKLALMLWVFLANILVYWLSPDYRARYIFMLIPFLLIPCFYLWRNELTKYYRRGSLITLIITLISIVGMWWFVSTKEIFPSLWVMIFILVTGILVYGFMRLKSLSTSLLVLSCLLIIRIGYSETMVPFRVKTGPYLKEKEEALKFAAICGDEKTYMYHSNLSLTMNWYFSVERMQMLETRRKDFAMNAYYFVPSDVITDSENVEVFDTFVRRFGNKKFMLVKFRHYFPSMPKKKE